MLYNVPLGYTSLIVAIFFSTGMILMSLGIIGEYIRKIWISQKKLDQIILIENDSE
jgi:undecaprenyl-phosphate 4-deoxy-4-formamido-L-arabinose transferase